MVIAEVHIPTPAMAEYDSPCILIHACLAHHRLGCVPQIVERKTVFCGPTIADAGFLAAAHEPIPI